MDIPAYLLDRRGIPLDPQQTAALLATQGPALLLAVPGGGKTTVLVSRVAHLVLNEGVAPQNILILTFNRESAKDMAARFQALFGELISQTPRFSTIHSFCYTVLKQYASLRGQPMPSLLESEPGGKARVLREIVSAATGEYADEEQVEEAQRLIGLLINTMVKPQEADGDKLGMPAIGRIYAAYQAYKKENHLMDYDDMLDFVHIIFRKLPDLLEAFRRRYSHVLVDEAQDTSKLQHAILLQLCTQQGNLFLVGDEDQSIYSFRGAYPQALLEFPKVYPGAKLLKMEQNFRCPPSVVEAANCLIGHNRLRYDKGMFTRRPDTGPVKITQIPSSEELPRHLYGALSQLPAGKTAAVLYRNNPSAVGLIDLFDRKGLPFYIKDHKTTLRRQTLTQDVLCILNLYFSPWDLESFQRVYYKLGAYISRAMVQFAMDNPRTRDTIFDLLAEFPDSQRVNTARLMFAKYTIGRFGSMTPSKILDAIFYDLGYFSFLEKSENGFLLELNQQRLMALKHLAASTSTIEEFLDRIDAIDGVISAASQNRDAPVTLSTIHSAKGLEFDYVYIIDPLEGVLPSTMAIERHLSRDPELLEEETRLFYVAITRAREQLEILVPASAGGSSLSPSRFLSMLKPDDSAALFEHYGLQAGRRVMHRYFGLGVVAALDFEKRTFTARFAKLGIKTLTVDILENPDTCKLLES
ncbi:ATP-dependent helicase [Merdimmobilis hominis]|uniref:DNA 3'-5' helicase n=1 Tax=uncultured Anaerotruncus sp. TaxID=905011 RepID=A0A6N2SPN1_9FIRM|nr:ATP-dependent helicase [Merdimmobilis hominis]MCD4836143.1 ATP-dependent helicase [Merdimmobilis hominis]PWL59116.1 MAG: ATP-dependent helicase [Oscillospiraceae bacterium]